MIITETIAFLSANSGTPHTLTFEVQSISAMTQARFRMFLLLLMEIHNSAARTVI